MAHLFRPQYTKPIPAGAEIVTRRGRQYATWTSRGRQIVWPVALDNPTRYVGRVKCWWVRFRRHDGSWSEESASPDRMAAERIRLEIIEREERIRHGILPATVATDDLEELLASWEQSIHDRGRQSGHAELYRKRATAVMRHAGAGCPAELTAADVTAVLAGFRRSGVPESGRPLSVESSNHYLTAIRAFVRWCIERGYIGKDPLAGCRKLNADAHRTFKRRALLAEEFERLLSATSARRVRCAVPGPDRAMAYYVCAHTGFRLRELSSLTPASFRLDESPPVVQLPASKGRAPTVQVIDEAVAARLRPYLKGKSGRLWYGSEWTEGRRASRVLRGDLKAAGIPYRDASGRVFNFHSLRVQFATNLARAGVPLQHAQRLLRHSDPKLTAAIYTDLGHADLAEQLRKVPQPKW